MLDNLDQPSLSYDDDEIKQAIFVHEGTYTLYVNKVGQAALLWDFKHLDSLDGSGAEYRRPYWIFL